MLPPSESLRNAAAVVLEHLRTDGTLSRPARQLGLCGYVVWPKIDAGAAPDPLYQHLAEILAQVTAEDPIITQTAWGTVAYNDADKTYKVMAETQQGEIAITGARHGLPQEGTVFWFDADALASLQQLASGNTPALSYAAGRLHAGR
jgi:hypothetical protein